MSAEKTAWKLYGTRQTGISSIQPQSVIGLQFLSYLTITTLIIMDTSGQKLSTSRELYSTEYQIESKRIKGKRENYSAVFLFFSPAYVPPRKFPWSLESKYIMQRYITLN